MSVNHDGDSDSTGSITGNILGSYLGVGKLPKKWLGKIEMKEEINQIADDLLVRYKDTKKWWDRYPGY